MQKKLLISIFLLLRITIVAAQTVIPFGTSLDSIEVFDGYYHLGPKIQSFHCYKPSTYDSTISPILFAMHGSGGSGISAINDLDSIAERRKALIIAPNFSFSGFPVVTRHQEPVYTMIDSISWCITKRSSTKIITEIYRHVLQREGRVYAPVYMIGFSAGAQFVTRYMLMRQVYPDSIPIKMAVSSNAYYYTFPIDTFMGIEMKWLCGIVPPDSVPGDCAFTRNIFNFCNEHAIQYYNENYGVLIGTGDTQTLNDAPCAMVQGSNRYERALNFYNFADSNAINRGTTLQWQYQEIIGVGHDQDGMYNTKATPTDTSTIAETLLFDTPFHIVPSLAPVASFYADTTLIYVNGTVNFFNTSINATSYLWDFGDGSTSILTSPSHVYTTIDTFIVQLTAINNAGCDNWTEKRHYIKVVNPISVNEINGNGFQIKIYPNPATDKINISTNNISAYLQFILYDIIGKEQKRFSFSQSTQMNIQDLADGIYLYKVFQDKNILGVGKIIKQ